MMNASKLIFVATGRFQMVHPGSLHYLFVAKYLAHSLRGEFFVLTGPFDDELPVHGERVRGAMRRRLLSFRERAFLLSRTLGVEEQKIYPQSGSPHHDKLDLLEWVGSFFDGLIRSDIIEESDLRQPKIGKVVLVVAQKPDDERDYLGDGINRHYSDLLQMHHPGIAKIDYSKIAYLNNESPALSSSRQNEDMQTVVTAMHVAEFLLREYAVEDLSMFGEVFNAAEAKFNTLCEQKGDLESFLKSLHIEENQFSSKKR